MPSLPVDRAAFLMSLSAGGVTRARPATPRTMTTSGASVCSYQMEIAFREWADNGWWIKEHRNSSLTTNRHIRACIAAAESSGLVATGQRCMAGGVSFMRWAPPAPVVALSVADATALGIPLDVARRAAQRRLAAAA
jgi:hypothetical protein